MSPYRAHKYAFWLSVCPRPFVDAIVDRYGEECTTDVLEAMVMSGRRKTWPYYHALVLRDVMFWCGAAEIEKIRRHLEARTLTYKELGLLDESYIDVLFANRVVSTEADWDSFKDEWLATTGEARPVIRSDGLLVSLLKPPAR